MPDPFPIPKYKNVTHLNTCTVQPRADTKMGKMAALYNVCNTKLTHLLSHSRTALMSPRHRMGSIVMETPPLPLCGDLLTSPGYHIMRLSFHYSCTDNKATIFMIKSHSWSSQKFSHPTYRISSKKSPVALIIISFCVVRLFNSF